MGKLLLHTGICIAETTLGFWGFGKMFERREIKKWWQWVGIIALLAFSWYEVTIDNWNSYVSTIGILLGEIFPVLFLFFSYQCRLRQAYFYEVFYLAFIGLLKTIFLVIVAGAQGKTLYEMNILPGFHTYTGFLYKIVLLIGLYFLLKQIKICPVLKEILSLKLIFLFMGMGFIIAVLALILLTGDDGFTLQDMSSALMVSISTIVGMYLAYKLIKSILREKILLEKNNKLLKKQYKEAREAYERKSQMLHDEKHLINYMMECFKEEKIQDAIKILEKFQENVQKQEVQFWTGISTLDILLNLKKQEMDQLGIYFKYQLKIDSFPISDVDLVTLLGNLFDNAIEAAKESQEKIIFLSIQTINQMCLLRIENSIFIQPQKKGGVFITSKNNKEIHGIGLQSVSSIVQGYGGTIEFNYNDKKFSVSIILGCSSNSLKVSNSRLFDASRQQAVEEH